MTRADVHDLDLLLRHPAVRVDRFAHLRILDRLHHLRPGDPAILDGWIQSMLLSNRPAPVWDVVRHWPHEPGNNPAQALIAAQVAQVMGQADEARTRYRCLIKQHPDMVDAWQKYVDFESADRLDEADIAHLEAMLAPTRDAYVREKASFTLASYHEKTSPGRAFLLADEAHRLKRQRIGAWDVSTVTQRLEMDRRRLPLPASSAALPQPIFVVGLPRSGTTLLTRLLGSHSQACGLGEQNLIASLALTACRDPSNRDPRLAAFVQAWYRAAVGDLADGARVAVDKLPANVEYIGLILSMFPDALIVPMQRDLADCAMSMHLRDFEFGCLYADSAEDLSTYAAQVDVHIRYWANAAPERVLPMRYEALVTNPRGALEPLLMATGLSWEDEMLDFWRDDEQIATFSESQVRQPIHDHSIGSWRRFLPEAGHYLRTLGVSP